MLVSSDTFATAAERIAKASSLVVDLETSGLRPYKGDRLFGVAVGCDADGPAFYFPFRHRTGRNLPAEKLPPLLDLICSLDRPSDPRELGGHNFIRFDVPMIAMEDERYYRALLHDDRVPKWDTIIDALLANENEDSFGLEALGLKYLGADAAEKKHQNARLMELLRRLPGANARTSTRVLKGRMIELPPEAVWEYACGDVLDCRALRAKYARHHRVWGIEKLSREMYAYARLLAKIERRGLRINRSLAEQRLAQIAPERKKVLAQIAGLTSPTFNPQSPQQVCRLLGTPDAKKETLARCEHPVAKLITRYKKLGKVASTYYEAILDGLDARNVIHPQMNLTADPTDVGGTKSGRLSCSNPNFQNLVKRADDPLFAVRELVIPHEGNILLPHDYERAEMWMGAHYSRDVALWDAYHTNRDLYIELAQNVQKMGSACSRQEGKIGWLAIQYGVGAWKLAKMFGWSFKARDDCASWDEYNANPSVRFKQQFFELCPGIKEQMDALMYEAETRRVIRLWTGRVCHFDGVNSPPFTAWNRLIQGGVGEMVRHAMQRAESALEELDAHEVLQVHDELVVEAPEDKAAEAVQRTREVMCDFPQFWLRPRVDPKVGHDYHNVSDFPLKEAA